MKELVAPTEVLVTLKQVRLLLVRGGGVVEVLYKEVKSGSLL